GGGRLGVVVLTTTHPTQDPARGRRGRRGRRARRGGGGGGGRGGGRGRGRRGRHRGARRRGACHRGRRWHCRGGDGGRAAVVADGQGDADGGQCNQDHGQQGEGAKSTDPFIARWWWAGRPHGRLGDLVAPEDGGPAVPER